MFQPSSLQSLSIISILQHEIVTSPESVPYTLHQDINILRTLYELRKEKEDLEVSIKILRDDIEYIREEAFYYANESTIPEEDYSHPQHTRFADSYYLRLAVEISKQLEEKEEKYIEVKEDESRLVSNLTYTL